MKAKLLGKTIVGLVLEKIFKKLGMEHVCANVEDCEIIQLDNDQTMVKLNGWIIADNEDIEKFVKSRL